MKAEIEYSVDIPLGSVLCVADRERCAGEKQFWEDFNGKSDKRDCNYDYRGDRE